jgi:hypothetical protein
LNLNGAATFIINTTDSAQTVYLPDPNHPHVQSDATKFDITDTQCFEVTVGGTTSGTFATMTYTPPTTSDTILTMEGGFDLKISSNGFSVYADIAKLEIGPSSAPFITFSGYGLFIINSAGFAAEMDLSLSASNNEIPGISFNAQFNLVMNTTGQNVVYNIPSTLPPLTIPGTSPAVTVTSITIPSGAPQGLMQSNGNYASYAAPGPYIVITGSGQLTVAFLTLNGQRERVGGGSECFGHSFRGWQQRAERIQRHGCVPGFQRRRRCGVGSRPRREFHDKLW